MRKGVTLDSSFQRMTYFMKTDDITPKHSVQEKINLLANMLQSNFHAKLSDFKANDDTKYIKNVMGNQIYKAVRCLKYQ